MPINQKQFIQKSKKLLMEIHNLVNVRLELKWIFVMPGDYFSKHIEERPGACYEYDFINYTN